MIPSSLPGPSPPPIPADFRCSKDPTGGSRVSSGRILRAAVVSGKTHAMWVRELDPSPYLLVSCRTHASRASRNTNPIPLLRRRRKGACVLATKRSLLVPRHVSPPSMQSCRIAPTSPLTLPQNNRLLPLVQMGRNPFDRGHTTLTDVWAWGPRIICMGRIATDLRCRPAPAASTPPRRPDNERRTTSKTQEARC